MSNIKILVIGKKSLLSNCFKSKTTIKDVTYQSYKNINKIRFNKYTHIINFSIDPKIYKNDYNFTNKIDLKICKKIKKLNCIYIFPSTRLVYSKSKSNLYGINKKKIEKDILKIKKKSLILRISNILTYDVSLRNLFISNLLRSLKKDSFVKLDISKSTYKDFIISDLFVKILDELIKKNIVGKFNLSSNIPIRVSEIVNQIIKGYGVGTIIMSEKMKKNNSFILKNNKLKKIVRFKTSKKKILQYCFKLGKKLNA
jgi:dTDP-4-dehydrorhamnose reductase